MVSLHSNRNPKTLYKNEKHFLYHQPQQVKQDSFLYTVLQNTSERSWLSKMIRESRTPTLQAAAFREIHLPAA